jgi:hypothetical protein
MPFYFSVDNEPGICLRLKDNIPITRLLISSLVTYLGKLTTTSKFQKKCTTTDSF